MTTKYTQLLLIILFLTSCAGGGGSSQAITPSPSPSPTPDPGPTYDQLKAQYESNYEYQQQWGLALAKASSAYARGSTGKNITIGITDSGLDVDHAEIDKNRILPGSYLSYSNYTPNTRQKRHGTMVASVAAGSLSKNNQTPMHGVAFDADIFFVAIQLAEPDDTYDPIDIGDGSGGDNQPDFSGVDNFFENLFKVFTSRKIDIVNNSYGYSGNIIDYTETAVRNAFPKTIQAIAQTSTHSADKTIFVWAAGNAGGYADQGVDYSSPEIFPGMTHFIEEIQGHSIAVVSVDEDGEISDFSSRCGVAADFCIAAPGGRVIGAYPTSLNDTGIYDADAECVSDNSCYALISGTSFAAPFVSGALAVLFEHFEGQLGSTEIVSRLFKTANDTGIYSDSSIYGHGLIDLNAATNPVGSLSVSTSNTIFGQMAPLFTSGLNASNTMIGASIANGLKNKSLIAFDELGSPFRIALGSLIATSSSNYNKLNPSGAFSNPKRTTYSENKLTYEYIHRYPLNDIFNVDENYFSNFSELSKSINILDFQSTSFYSIGQNDNEFYSTEAYNTGGHLFENPYLDFTKHGLLVSKSMSLKTFDLTWVASIGQPKISIEEVFHDRSINSQLSIILSNSFLPEIQLGWLNEKDSVMSLGSSGAFDFSKNTDSFYAGIHKTFQLSKSFITFTGYKSYATDNKFNNSLIKSARNVETSFYKAELIFPNIFNNINLEFGFTKPLFVSKGELDLALPVYRDRYLNLYVEDLSLPLSSQQEETITSISIKQFKEHGSVTARLESVENPNHGNIYKDYLNFSIGYSYLF
ncbi:MAG: S8 family peptidase [Gammaproteobacteria bacterium]